MNLNYSSKAFSQLTHNEHSKKSAIHEAGHAVATYLGNRQKQLPPFFFQLYIKEQSNHFQLSAAGLLLGMAASLILTPVCYAVLGKA